MSANHKGHMRCLLGNTLVFALGGPVVKAVSLVLIPLYTTVLTASEHRTTELFSSAIEIMLPLLSLDVVEALYQFSINDNAPKNELFADSPVVLDGGVVCTGVACVLGSVLRNIEHTAVFFTLFCSVYVFKAMTQLARGLRHVRCFVAYGLINVLTMAVSTYSLLVRVHTGIEGYPWSYTIGHLVGGLTTFLGSAEYRLLVPFRLDRALLCRMFVYNLPLVPNLLSWWLVNAPGRCVVLWGGDLAVAGPFTAASKMPSLINIVASVSQQTWQYSTACEIDSLDRSTFLGSVLRDYSLVTLSTAGLVIVPNRPISRVMLQAESAEGRRYVPLFALATTFGVMTIFFSTSYQALMNSRVLMASIMMGAVVGAVLGVTPVSFMGLWDVGLAGAVAYALALVVWVQDLRRHIDLPMDRSRLIYQLALLSIMSMCTSFDDGAWPNGVIWAYLILLTTSGMSVLGGDARAVTGVFADRLERY